MSNHKSGFNNDEDNENNDEDNENIIIIILYTSYELVIISFFLFLMLFIIQLISHWLLNEREFGIMNYFSNTSKYYLDFLRLLYLLALPTYLSQLYPNIWLHFMYLHMYR